MLTRVREKLNENMVALPWKAQKNMILNASE